MLIDTPNLGRVLVSEHVFNYIYGLKEHWDQSIARNEVIDVLKSTEIEKLVTPVASPGLEFWVHRSSSLVFTALPKEGVRQVSMVLKRDMSDFVFDTE